jgi:predicted nucleic-acid-binding Zn-ribbon protein
MNIYLLDDLSKPSIHPIFAHVGTWSKGASTCKTCGNHNQVLIEPLLIEWFDGSLNIGDFSWCGYTAVVQDRVKDWMQDNQFEVSFGRAEVVRPTLKKGKMPRVAFPYNGPNLHWLIATERVRLDERKSGIEPIPDCPVCGQKRTKFVRKGIVIPKENWHGQKIFDIDQNGKSGAMFITEEALGLMAEQEFNNYITIPAGKIEG